MTWDRRSIEELLKQTPFLQGLSPSDLSTVADIAFMEQIERSTILFREGSICDRLFLVVEGLIALEMCLPRRGCVRILTVGPREIVGVSALLKNARMTTRAIAVESTTLITFPAQQLQDLCDADHDVGYVVMNELSLALASRLLATRLQLLDVFRETQPAGRSDS